MEHRIVWEIGITADTPEDAAKEALRVQRDPDSTAVVFLVKPAEGTPVEIDLQSGEVKQVKDQLYELGLALRRAITEAKNEIARASLLNNHAITKKYWTDLRDKWQEAFDLLDPQLRDRIEKDRKNV